MVDIRLNGQKIIDSLPKYPFIGRCENENGWFIVLFREPACGTVIVTNHKNWVIGETSDSFTMSNFTPLPKGEKIVLRNS